METKLAHMDLNHDWLIQSQVCYRYTMGHRLKNVSEKPIYPGSRR